MPQGSPGAGLTKSSGDTLREPLTGEPIMRETEPVPEKSILPVTAYDPKITAHSDSPRRKARSLRGTPAPSQDEKRKIRIVVADLEGIFRLGLKRVLEADAALEVVAEIDHPERLAAEVGRLQPDVMFIQNEMLLSESGALPFLRAASPETKIVVTASTLAEEEPVGLVAEGARGAILKTADPALFVKCAHKVAEGEIWLPKKQVAEIARRLSEHGTRPVDTLTAREKLVISCLVQEGWRNRDIAEHLSISEQTVKNHLRSIYDKVGVSDRVELVLYAIHQHLDLPSVAGKQE